MTFWDPIEKLFNSMMLNTNCIFFRIPHGDFETYLETRSISRESGALFTGDFDANS